MNIQENISLLPHNTFNINATARFLAIYNDENELREILTWHHNNHPTLPILPLGRGSNLLFTTPVYDGLVLVAAEKSEIAEHENHVTAWAGQTMDNFILWTIEHELFGLENLSWIPGSVGASAVQNIGAYGAEVSNCIDSVVAVNRDTLETRTFNKDELCYSYRDSWFKHHREWIVTRVTYKLDTTFTPNLTYGGLARMFEEQKTQKLTAAAVRQAVIDTRIAKLPDPKKEGNAGSFFMNPIVGQEDYERIADGKEIPRYPAPNGRVKLSAAWLIEQSGCKGMEIGPAAVSHRHALILINKGGASGKDIVNICREVQKKVQDKFGIALHPEVNFL